ncbi:hypothetical protein HK102_005354 [Quaeritorhiza haematococci]|nr:hypothetical protein HK102_005354 [Quaeritorhiza haematococci]
MNMTDTEINVSTLPRVEDDEKSFKKGGHALRKLKAYCDQLSQENSQLRVDLKKAKELTQSLASERNALQKEVTEKYNTIAQLRKKDTVEVRNVKNQEETERILNEETLKRTRLEQANRELWDSLEHAYKNFEDLKRCRQGGGAVRSLDIGGSMSDMTLSSYTTNEEKQAKVIDEQAVRIQDLEALVKSLRFEIDELKVTVVRHQNRNDELEKATKIYKEKNEHLSQMEATYKKENALLQKRLKEALEANKEVTGNYQAMKRNHDMKRNEFEVIVKELEEAKAACQVAIKQRNHLRKDLDATIAQKKELSERTKNLEATINQKEKEVSDLVSKVNETINEYELKLERKEEQMWAMTLQMSEETQRQRNHMNIDADFINDMEKKWKAKEKTLQGEVEGLTGQLQQKEDVISGLFAQIAQLSKSQYEPRMERIQAIEKELKAHIEEYVLAEERMETGLLCPRDLTIFVKPTTLVPCGHTFCGGCVNAIRDENYNDTVCQVCSSKATNTFHNQQLESVCEQFLQRRGLAASFLEWTKELSFKMPEESTQETKE